MNRSSWLLCGIFLLLTSPALQAQRHVGHGAGGTSPQSPPSISKPDDLVDFKRSIALQATPDQAFQFQSATNSIEAARKSAQDLVRLAGIQSQGDLFHSSDSLSSTVDEAQHANLEFVQSFSSSQKAGLKDVSKKLAKANFEVTKLNKALSQHLSQSALDSKVISDIAAKLDQALGDLQLKQLAIADRMGINNSQDQQ